MKQFYVYIMANRSRTLYTGMTNALLHRVWQHKHMETEGFTRRYLIDRLVYYEEAPDAASAIRREKQIKGWVRRKKIALIESTNPEWRDLSEDFMDIRPKVPPGPFHRQERGRRDSSLAPTTRRASSHDHIGTERQGQAGAQNDMEAAS